MKQKKSLKINAISNWITLVVHIAIGFVLTPFIIGKLGKTGYGIWTLVGSFIGYYGLLNLGVGSAVTRYIARYSARDDAEGLNETANTALMMFSLTCLLAIGISVAIAGPLTVFFKVQPEHCAEFKRIVWILGLSTGLSFPSGLFAAMVAAREHYVAANIINVSVALLRSGLTVVILLAGYGLAGIAYPTLTATVISLVAFTILAKRIVPEFHVRFRTVRLATLKTLLLYGTFTTVISVADILRTQIDSLVIGRMVGMAEVGVYSVAAMLLRYLIRSICSGLGVLTPRFAALDGKGDCAQARRLLRRGIAVSAFLAFGGFMMAVVFGNWFILWWVGPEFTDAVTVLWILSLSSVFAIAQNPAIGFMYAVNKHKYYAAVTIVEAIANLGLSILFVYKYGMIGVALGTMVSMLVVKVLAMPLYVSRVAGITIREYVAPIIPPAIIGSSIVALTYWCGILTEETYAIGALVGIALAIAAIYVVAYYVVMRRWHPDLLRSLVSRGSRKVNVESVVSQ